MFFNSKLNYRFISCLLVLMQTACSHIPEGELRANEKQVQQMGRYLQLNEVQKATAMKYFLDRANFPINPEILAQYHLQTCNPYAAFKNIQKMPNGNRRKLYTAVLSALISTNRKTGEISQRKKWKISEVKLPLDEQEIWRDEWSQIGKPEHSCKEIPVVKLENVRRKYQKIARKLFSELPSKVFEIDFNILALALDVGYRPKNLESIMKYYKDYRSNPYFSRLAKKELFSEEARSLVDPLRKKNGRIELSGMILSRVVEVPHEINVPIILNEQINE